MARTNKIRINELARELEVKASAILDALQQVGVAEKKTHSSSIDDTTADKVRSHVRQGVLGSQAKLPELELPVRERPKPKPAAPPPTGMTSTSTLPSIRPSGGPPRGPLKPPVILKPPLKTTAPVAAPIVEKPVARVSPPPAGPRVEAPRPGPPTVPAAPPAPARPAAREAPAIRPAAPGAPLPPPVPRIPKVGADRGAAPVRRGVGNGAARSTQSPGGPGRPVRPIPRTQGDTGGLGPRAPLAPSRRAAGPGQPAPGAPRPGTRPRGSAPGARTAQAPTPGKPIYERRPPGPVPGMPSPYPGGPRPYPGRGGPGGAPGRPPGAPGRPDTRRGRPPARPKRDQEAERETRFLQRQAAAKAAQAVPKAENINISIGDGATVKELGDKLGIKPSLIIKGLVDKGLFATINQTLDMETIKGLCKLYGAEVEEISFEEESLLEVELQEDAEELTPRAPVVTVMGHVDHGKTSLLDAIRETSVASREAGGITQAIGASEVTHNDRRIVFIDTPGHEAFTRMRAQGAKVTDIVVLVVAADDGVMPQTLEAIDHARAAGAPIIVAVNKIDRDNAQPDRVKQQLSDRGLMPEDWGGDTVFVNVSALEGTNIEQLLEMILLVADLGEFKANTKRQAVGTVLEAKLDRGQGPVATIIMQNGTLKVGDYFVVGAVFGKVRALINDKGDKVSEAGPSTAVVVLGLEGLPDPGDAFHVTEDIDRAKKVVEFRELKAREQAMHKTGRFSLEQLQERLKAGEIRDLPLVLKCDVQGSLDVLETTLRKLKNDKVQVQLISTAVGAISESDILLAIASNAIVVGFNVRPERNAAALAEREKIDIRLHTVIYELDDEIKKALAGLLEPVIKEIFEGRADVLEAFNVSKLGTVAGCMLQEGRASGSSKARLLRDNVVVHTGRVGSLRRFKDDVSEVRAGQECGIRLHNYNDVKQGDVIELFRTEKVAQELKIDPS